MKVKKMVYASFFSALCAVASQIAFTLPFSPIPINLALIPVILSGALLGATLGAFSVTLYLLLGIIGLPVFSHFASGIGYLLSYTGGFFVGYIALAYTVGFTYKKIKLNFFISSTIGLIVCYIFGSTWYSFVSGCNLIQAITIAVIPYIIADIFKIFVSYLIVKNKNIKQIT